MTRLMAAAGRPRPRVDHRREPRIHVKDLDIAAVLSTTTARSEAA
jgi:hypothetical protein